ncbi:magnesium transporter [Corynebacterium sp. TAE3-ERU12]|uniref:general stress protein n=1 Tax=Corynebacterium sp. TAE3-ERU12 TaxID=2849491 RepID=UPI001C43C969|nr:general stress protein [Corynebacterium sp. TAE3-ERU12]MBV7295069.1 magnesium transporter [Corynebacterium sp. TAE3-ERU12]
MAAQSTYPMPTPPEGWPVGSFASYEKAQQAVDMLSDLDEFPVSDLTIVGVDLMQVERVVGRLTWGKVLGGGALYGVWMGLFFGLLLGLFQEDWLTPLLVGVGIGAIFGLVAAAVPYAMQNGKRDFASTTQIVAGRYDVLCAPRNAERARDVLAQKNIR